MKTNKRSLWIFALLVNCMIGQAQEGMNKEVNVVKPYSPTIADAMKVRFMPNLLDTVKVDARFNYFIQPIMEPVEFRLRNLNPIALRSEKQAKLQNSYVRAGFGNYWTPYAELDINTTQNQNSSLGIHLGHLSSQGRIKMADDRKVYAGYADNSVKLYGSRFFNRSTLSGNIHFDEDHHYLYGYNTDTLSNGNLVTPFNLRATTKDSIGFQRFIVVGSDFRWKADERGRKGFLYQLDGGYDYLVDFQSEMEHNGRLSFDFSQQYKNWSFGGTVGANYAFRTRSADSVQYIVAHADPWVGFQWKYISLKAGPKVAMDRNAGQFFFYPQVNMEINITDLVVPYIGLNGYYENNNYLKIIRENPFVADDLDIRPTNHRFIAYGGLRGRFLPKVAFNLYVSWEDVDNWHFYLPDTRMAIANRFVVDYDNGSLLSAGGEISLRQSKNLSIILKGNYYKFTLDSLPAAWHRPEWDATLTTRYAWNEKLMLQADLYLIGAQYAPSVDLVKFGPTQKLDGLVDVNLSAEYSVGKGIAFFGRVNNLISDKYYMWQNYPVQGINFLLGISWVF